jgi:hypothetical protein
MAVDYTAITLSAEDHQFHWNEALRLRALAQTITTPAVRNRVLERAYEHARLVGAPTNLLTASVH